MSRLSMFRHIPTEYDDDPCGRSEDSQFGRYPPGWVLFECWRRKRNLELVELDAFRELVFLEDRLKEYPNAIPLLEAALKDYQVIEQRTKAIDIMHRLGKVDPLLKRLEPSQLCEETQTTHRG